MSSLFLALQLSRNTESEENKLTIYYYPFESHETGDESNPYDRAITAEQERMFNKLRYGNGVFNPDSGSLQVTSNSNMTVTVGKGGCHIEGAIAYNDAPIILPIEAADATLNRIDRVVAQFNTSDSVRAINILVRIGTAAANPVPPEARTQSNLYELVLADIYVGKNASSISTANITDQRLSSELCGQVVPAIPTPLNLDDIYSQYQASLDKWLDTVAMALDGTLAGNLQNQISALCVRIDNLILSTGNSPIEVKDARLGYDGTAYSTLKERLDTENSELKSDLEDNKDYLIPKQLFNTSDFKLGGSSNGYIQLNQNYRITNCEDTIAKWRPIKCKKGDIVHFKVDLSQSDYIGCRVSIHEVNTSGFLVDSGWNQGVQDGLDYTISNDSTTGINICFSFSKTSTTVTTGSTECTDDIVLTDLFNSVLFSVRVGSVPSNIELGEDISDIKYKINGSIPNYYAEHLNTKIALIKSNMMDCGIHGETFVFITDIHWDDNDKHSPFLIDEVLSRTNIKTIVCGGDLINEGEKAPMIETLQSCVSAFTFDKNGIFFPCAFGNHDSNKNNQAAMEDRWLSDNDVYALMYKQNDDYINYLNDIDKSFYFDNKTTKTRFIVLDSGVNGSIANQTVFTSLIDCMLSVDENWKIVIVCHWLYNNAWYQIYYDLSTAINAYNNRTTAPISTVGKTYDLSNAKGEVVLVLGGHVHNDMSTTTKNGTVPVVLTDCDNGVRTENTDYPYVKGSVTEQCFDVMTINYTNRTVKCVRVGRGADREFTF